MKNTQNTQIKLSRLFLGLFASLTLLSCSEEANDISEQTKSATHVAVLTGTPGNFKDVLLTVDNLNSGEASPINSGTSQPRYSHYTKLKDGVIVTDYIDGSKTISKWGYSDSDELVKKGSLTLSDRAFCQTMVDDKTLIAITAPDVKGNAAKIHVINTDNMKVINSKELTLATTEKKHTLPSSVLYRNGKIFISIFDNNTKTFARTFLPDADTARMVVLDYPSLDNETNIVDERCSNIGRVQGETGLQLAETGDIYTCSPASVYAGFGSKLPPYFLKKQSGILKIKKGEANFDASFHLNFEEIQPNYKIVDMYYVANGKAVLRVVKEEPFIDLIKATDAVYGAVDGRKQVIETGVLDINAKTFTLLTEVPKSIGTFISPRFVEGNKVYFPCTEPKGVSSQIYSVDVTNNKVEKGLKVNYGMVTSILK